LSLVWSQISLEKGFIRLLQAKCFLIWELLGCIQQLPFPQFVDTASVAAVAAAGHLGLALILLIIPHLDGFGYGFFADNLHYCSSFPRTLLMFNRVHERKPESHP
jgi:hypothetical protein